MVRFNIFVKMLLAVFSFFLFLHLLPSDSRDFKLITVLVAKVIS